MYSRIKKIHFVGIGGVGMSGIAEVLLNLGYQVSGSDLRKSSVTHNLERIGAEVFVGHREGNLKDSNVVVLSSAINKNGNPEVAAARKMNIPVIPRAEMLAELMRMKYGVAIAGAHGKTTTTSLISEVLLKGGIDPTMVIGGRLSSMGGGAKLGRGKFLVAEADESDGTFLHLSPTIAVVTNIDPEHLDFYGDINNIKNAFLKFINKVPFYGLVVLCLDNKNIAELIPRVEKRHTTYGLSREADFQARGVRYVEAKTSFELWLDKEKVGDVCFGMPGLHNVYNALAAFAVGFELDVDFDDARSAIEQFRGIDRRFEIKGEFNGILVVDDYGHHPREIMATLSAIREGWGNRRLIVAFQPHRYTRTKLLYKDFLDSFSMADALLITEIYPAGEDPIEGVTGQWLAEGIRREGHKDIRLVEKKEDMVDIILRTLREDDIFLTLGAGDIWKVGEEVIKCLK